MEPEDPDRRFRSIYQAYQRPVLAYFLRRTDASSACDGAADTFLVAWRRINDVPRGESTLPWLYGVARRVLANQRRSQRRYRALGRKLIGVAPDDEASPEIVMLRRSEDEAILAAVSQLKPMDQEVLRLAVWEELPHAQIGEVVGTSAHAVTQRLHRITRTLARSLRTDTQTPPSQIINRVSNGGQS